MLQSRVGFACKYMHEDQDLPKPKLEKIQRQYNGRSVSLTSLRKMNDAQSYEKICEVVKFNLSCYRTLAEYVSKLPVKQRMLRLGSDLCPLYTHNEYNKHYNTLYMKDMIGHELSLIGEFCRDNDIRLSMHPGQFVSIVSDNPDVVDRSLQELEYHAMIATQMGYGDQFQDFKINVHLSGNNGASSFNNVYQRMSMALRNMLTLENDEYVCGIDDLFKLANKVPIVLDIHHHWIKYDEYIEPNDSRIKIIKDSWRGVRPVIHYSYSNEDVFPDGFVHDRFYTVSELARMGIKRGKLRAHSRMYPNMMVNQWALSHLEWADIMCEAKNKNIASTQICSLIN